MARNNQNLSEEMLKNIQNYGNEIRTIEDFVEVVRQNPGYHLGSKGNKGLKNMAREIWQNSFDELDKHDSPCDWIRITFDERTYGFSCEDNGRGIPYDNILRIYTNPNTSSNYDKKKGEYSSGLHGVGAKVTNAMSHKFIVESYRCDMPDYRRVELTEGHPWNKGNPETKEVSLPNKQHRQGTYVYFEPSVDALGEISITWKDVYSWVTNILPLSKIGAVVDFVAWDKNGKEYKERLVNQDGILTYLIKETDKPLIAPIMMHYDTGYMKMDVAVTWDASENSTDHIIAFANKCPTIFGTHIEGFEWGISQFFTSYMNKIYLANSKSKLSVISNDIKCGIKAVVTVAHLKPIFDGQSKEKLANEDMKPFMHDTVMSLLDQWTKTNSKDLAKLCQYFKDVAELRTKSDKDKVKLSNKYARNKLDNLPSKFVQPTGTKNIEFFITEGDSAASLMRNNRDNKRQGYFPIRGKIINTFGNTKEKIFNNEEINSIIAIVGGGYGRNFDINKVKWDKVIMCTDADPDGNHIRKLLLSFFMIYMPQLIEAGRLYAAMPPLYGVYLGKDSKGHKKYDYLRDRMEYVKYIQKKFSKSNTVKTVKGKPVSPKELSRILYNNMYYNKELTRIADNHALNPLFLEAILTLVINKVPHAKWQNMLKKQFKYIFSVTKNHDTIVIEALINDYQTAFVNDTLITEAKEIINMMKKNEALVYNVNDQIMTIYELMDLFDKSAPTYIQRYKGLGEMDGRRLFDSTLNPEDRCLIQYTVDDIKEELNMMRFYETNKAAVLQDVQVNRFDLMD